MSDFLSFDSFKKRGREVIGKGPIAILLAEDDVEVDSTLRHQLEAGFKRVIVVGAPEIELAPRLAEQVIRVDHNVLADNDVTRVVNAVIEMCHGQWIYYCFNAEYLFYPFCEHRTVGEMVSFCIEERRDAVLTYVIDLYAGDLHQHPDAVSLEAALLDKSGYYALARTDTWNNPLERQLNFFGGLRWRFEEHIPLPRRRIDRVAMFRSKPGLVLKADHTFNDAEYNTFACPWHNSLTAAICSFRTAKALKRNPGSTFDIETFRWHNSTTFDWHSQQLLDLGLMEPGQWF